MKLGVVNTVASFVAVAISTLLVVGSLWCFYKCVSHWKGFFDIQMTMRKQAGSKKYDKDEVLELDGDIPTTLPFKIKNLSKTDDKGDIVLLNSYSGPTYLRHMGFLGKNKLVAVKYLQDQHYGLG